MSADPVLDAVEDTLAGVFAELRPLADRFRALAAEHGPALARDDLAVLRPGVAALLAGHRPLVAGAGVVVAPGLLADREHWLEWWWSGPNGAPQPLRVNLDPTAPDFFDYTTADWWTTPERTAGPHVSGPYVDHACTNEYAVTLVLPVHEDTRLLGIAAADLPVARLERAVLPGLPDDAALVTAAGRVVVSSSPRLAPGLLVPPPAGGTPAGRLTAWRVVPAGQAGRGAAAASSETSS